MNNKITVLIMSFFLAASAYAKQSSPPSKPITADDIVAKMKFQLQLTDQQAERVKLIIEDYLEQEKQLKLEEKKQLRKVLTSGQMYTWNFLQNDKPKEKKHSKF
jgi:Spy/CpxP family protein refolding chaperone